MQAPSHPTYTTISANLLGYEKQFRFAQEMKYRKSLQTKFASNQLDTT
jgi:hypothetical protein